MNGQPHLVLEGLQVAHDVTSTIQESFSTFDCPASASRIHSQLFSSRSRATGRSSLDKLVVVLKSSPSLYTRTSETLCQAISRPPLSPWFAKTEAFTPRSR